MAIADISDRIDTVTQDTCAGCPPSYGMLSAMNVETVSAISGIRTRSFRLSSAHRFQCGLAMADRISAHRYYDGSDSCQASPRPAGLLAYLAHTSQRSASNHKGDPDIALHAISAYPMCFRLRPLLASSPSLPAESSSLSCGPPVRLQLLSTPPRSDAVTFGYRVLAYPGTDSHRAGVAPSRAHSLRPAGSFLDLAATPNRPPRQQRRWVYEN